MFHVIIRSLHVRFYIFEKHMQEEYYEINIISFKEKRIVLFLMI